MKKIQDYYFHKARREGYVARSAYKLEEIDQQHRLLKQGQKVLDLGCCPGSWMQYTAQKITPGGSLLGIDLQPVSLALPDFVTVLQADIFELERTGPWWETPFDVILSDMAPKTSGIRSLDADRSQALNQQVLWLASEHLRVGGNLLVKAFQGGSFQQLQADFRQQFAEVKVCKPRSSRSESVEVFVLGKSRRAPEEQEGEAP